MWAGSRGVRDQPAAYNRRPLSASSPRRGWMDLDDWPANRPFRGEVTHHPPCSSAAAANRRLKRVDVCSTVVAVLRERRRGSASDHASDSALRLLDNRTVLPHVYRERRHERREVPWR